MHETENAQGESARVLMVHHVWLWKIKDVVISAFPEEAFQDGSNLKIFHKYTDWGTVEYDSVKAIGKFLSVVVDSFDRPISAGLSEPILNIFEKSITNLSEEVNEYLKSIDVEDLEVEKEKRYFHEISDIREELSMIKLILSQQEEVWKDYLTNAWPDYWVDGRFIAPLEPENHREDWRIITRPQRQFQRWRARIERLDENAERVEKSISTGLDLKQKYATLHESHSTAVMSAAIFGFSIITIIFTPLSFILALFALPIKSFEKDASGSFSTKYVGRWAATTELVSVSLTLVAMWLAVEFGLRVRISRKIGQWFKSRFEKMVQWFKSNSEKPAVTKKVAPKVGSLNTPPYRLPMGGAKAADVKPATATAVEEPEFQNAGTQEPARSRTWPLGRRRSRKDIENGG